MSVFDRIGKMADMAWQEAASKLDLHERGGGHSSHAGHAGASRGIAELEERYEEALQRTIELRKQSVDAQEMAQLRAEQAELAMRAGDEELARMALQEKLRLEAACAQYRAQYASSQDVCLALADELAALRAGRAAGTGQPRSGLSKEEARETLRELEATGRELGREALQGLRVAGRVSKETLKEAGNNLQQELRKLQQNWRDKK
ncbi:hypothetical protein HZF08_20325 [Paenibacillus sp. CGMCC 1.16610]|uniref:PspA/IM30 family protein n=1 Tax=Paenibacillus anseongense TaxID=2682845 RepID=A0ABW9UA00_9BACL|nr:MULTISPECIES: hypothetical protein [Paenibacillus]MBA2940650.1 hypothetical protein [Paenibacillus sp. CGMCC 1.16610]MVQ35826.1 hypothetical protein [Paenibacillus anseongense]